MKKEERLLIALYIVIILACLSCGVERATQKVLTNEIAFNKVGEKWSKLNPCTNDTLMEFIKGDTVTTHSTDTLIENKYYNDTLVIYITKTVNKTIRDTINKKIIDIRLLNITKDSLAYQKQNVARLTGMLDQTKLDNKKQNKWLIAVGLFSALLLIIIGILIRFKL
jgi:hypothetical protein